MICGSDMVPKYFYLYLRSDSFALKKLIALLCGNLPLTNARRFNDPFDSKLGLDHSRKIIQLNDNEMDAVGAGYFSKDDFEKHHQNLDELEMRDRYNLACFSESYDSLLMWAHYADAHKGICLKLKYYPKRLPAGCFFKKVRYSTHYPKINVLQTEERSEVETFFLTKSVDWLYEREWRLVVPVEMKGNDDFDGEIPSPFDVESVYLGIYCDARKLQDAVESEEYDMPEMMRFKKSKTDFCLEL
jgi:hypothetical protein